MKIGAAALLCALAMALGACGGGAASTTSSAPASTASTPATTASEPTDTEASDTGGGKGAYPKEARDSFLTACTASADKEQCECALNYLEKNVPIEDLVKAGLESQSGKTMPKVLSDAVAACT
jgi:hypothetical protein